MTKKRKSKSKSKSKSIKLRKSPTVILPEGTLIYHGHPEVKEWAIPHDRPAFFGGTTVALYYAGNMPKYISTYALFRPVYLLDLSKKQNFKKFYDEINISEKNIFSRVTGFGLTNLNTEECKYKNKPKTEIRFCTEGFVEPQDEKEDNYAMLKFARIVCKYNYDGYYLTPTYRRAYSNAKNVPEQIILCHAKNCAVKLGQQSLKNMKKII